MIDFTKSPIVALVGGNDAGKTSTIKALTNLMYNNNNNDCKKHIRTGTKRFKSSLALRDGTAIDREKALEGMNGYKMTRGGAVICEHTKLDVKENGIVPPEIAQALGVVWEKETKELLNVRTYESLLLFSLTTGSDNYRIMYNALKIGDINKAIKIGKQEVSGIKDTIDTNLNSIKSLQSSIQSIRLFDIEPVQLIKEKIRLLSSNVEKLGNLLGKIERVRECEELIKVVDASANLKPIDIGVVSSISRLGQLIQRKESATNALGQCSQLDNLATIPEGAFTKMVNLVAKKVRLDKLNTITIGLGEVDGLQGIAERPMQLLNKLVADLTRAKDISCGMSAEDDNWITGVSLISEQTLIKIQQLCGKIIGRTTTMQGLEASIQEENAIMTEIAQLGAYSEEVGGFVKRCPDCGSQVIVTLDELLSV